MNKVRWIVLHRSNILNQWRSGKILRETVIRRLYRTGLTFEAVLDMMRIHETETEN